MPDLTETSTVVFYLDAGGEARAIRFAGAPAAVLGPALQQVEALRQAGMRHVCISSENAHSVGLPGVTGIENGKMPNGLDYGWTKRRRRS